jgi:hypothetical protein
MQVYSDMEDRLEEIETNPAFQAMMAKSAADSKAGRVIPTRKWCAVPGQRLSRVKCGEMENRLGCFRWEVFDELPETERNEILEHLKCVKRFPHVYPVRTRAAGFVAIAGCWLEIGSSTIASFENTVYIRGLWPARIP